MACREQRGSRIELNRDEGDYVYGEKVEVSAGFDSLDPCFSYEAKRCLSAFCAEGAASAGSGLLVAPNLPVVLPVKRLLCDWRRTNNLG